VPGDFALEHFSISKDLETLVPFIKNALRYRPNLKLWASPWSPPTWMKYNNHYAAKMSEPQMPPNGLRPDQAGKEGSDLFIQEDLYFSTYASYIARFIRDYGSQGINIGMVMPQNEFNSAQPFPSCCWTPEGLARFILDTISLTGYENLLAFANPDQSVVILMQNDLCQELPVRVKAGGKVIAATLQADSFNTFVVRA
jgi:O-glycosyl hydrolase